MKTVQMFKIKQDIKMIKRHLIFFWFTKRYKMIIEIETNSYI